MHVARRTALGRALRAFTSAGLALAGVAAMGATPAAADEGAVLSAGLEAAATANPDGRFRVIVHAADGRSTGDLVATLREEIATDSEPFAAVSDRYSVIPAASATLSGADVAALATDPAVDLIVRDTPVVPTAVSAGGYSNEQMWPQVPQAPKAWASGLAGPAIAVVDSGIDAARNDFRGRVVADIDLMTGPTANAPADGYGHGTFVAGIAAGAAAGRAGVAPQAPIVSIDVMDDRGMAMTSDVIAAADWIFLNRGAYDIGVVNFSLTRTVPSSFMWDPLDRAVEALWQRGVVVVAAAGNYGSAGAPSGVRYAPGNDPFVITVGAADLNGTGTLADDFAAPWSAYGYTPDGFRKPELCAPGRVLEGPVPTQSTIATEHPERMVAPGYAWLSGTSFAAPVVAGAAGYVLARHPTWEPDDVKGALMLAAAGTSEPTGGPCGVGHARAASAAAASAPPNPNLALNAFLVPVAGSQVPVFDSAAWALAATASPTWDAASWASASWASASWASASWASASWASASWASASWASGTTPDGSIADDAEGTWVR